VKSRLFLFLGANFKVMASDNKDLKNKAEKVNAIHKEYIQKIEDLRREQNRVIDEFIQELEKAKIEELKSKL
jgi:hypothetical protein